MKTILEAHKKIATTLVLLFTVSLTLAQPIKKLLLIGIDGCRADAMIAANAPTLDSLMSHGTFTLHAQTIYPTWSGPGWSSMLTGVWYTKHGVTNNTFLGSHFDQYPHFFNHIEAYDSSLYTASICQWTPVNNNIVDQADLIVSPNSGAGVASTAANLLSAQDPDVVFLHFDDVDHEGHSTGFGPTNPLYVNAIEDVDGFINTVMIALRSRPNLSNEEWLIMVSTDHGGIGTNHGGNTDEEKTIFLILTGAGLPVQELLPVVTTTPSSSALVLNGVNQYASASALPAYNFGTNTDFTVECRVISSGWSGDPAIVSDKDWNNGSNDGFVIAGRTNGTSWKVNIGDGNNRIDLNGGTINDNQFHHLALSVDRGGFARIFQDGRIVDSTSVTSLGDIGSGLPLGFGQDGTLSYPDFFDGTMDEVRLWNAALPNAVLADWTCRSLNATHPNAANLVGYWKLDDNTGTMANDSSGNNNAATLVNAPSWVTPVQQLECVETTGLPRMVDIAPTALEFLCIPIQTAWQLDGVPLFSFCATNLEDGQGNVAHELYPNPTTGQVTVRWKALEEIENWRLLDARGREVAVKVLQANDHEMVLDCAALPAGVYFLRLGDNRQIKTLRLVKM